MKAFVTGGTGFIGSHLVNLLISRGHQVTSLVRNPHKASALFGTGSSVHLVQGDLANQAALERAMADADVVYHVAGLTGAPREADLMAVNRDGTARVLAAAHRTAPRLTRLVLVSSLSAAGPSRRGAPRVESDPDAPVSAYGRSKLAGEAVVRGSSLPWTIVRPPTVYGPRDREVLRVFQVARLPLIPTLGPPDQELSLVHVADLARALVAATGDRCSGRTYFAGHPQTLTGRDMLAAMRTAIRRVHRRSPGPPPRVFGLPAFVGRAALWASGSYARLRGEMTLLNPDKLSEFRAEAWTCRSDALERDTGWAAGLGAPEGLLETARWYVEHGWL
ncbi:MAG TPA: NAD-dependent epimerase/dehydratase family protein [Gemmatimonadales bacterium]|nr:NAD-dependent epimerase/dehydratase family protein [Gemmatimonadales bacterium]